jgi:hypothetical protein
VAVPKTPKITWSSAFAKTLTFPGPADFPEPDTEPIGKAAESRSGAERDFWETRTDYPLSVVVRFIPTIADVGSVNAFSTTDGWQDFIAWALKGNQFRYYPDKDTGTYYTCFLLTREKKREDGGSKYQVKLNMRSTTKVTSY